MPTRRIEAKAEEATPAVETVAPALPYDLNRTLAEVTQAAGLSLGVAALLRGLNAQISTALASAHLSAAQLDRIDQVFLEAERRHNEIIVALHLNAIDLRHGSATRMVG